MFGSFGIVELVLVLVIVLIVFGAGRLPQLGEGLGKAIKGFKKSVHDQDANTIEVDADRSTRQPEEPAPAASPPGSRGGPVSERTPGPSDHRGTSG